MLWIEIAFPHLGVWQRGAQPPLFMLCIGVVTATTALSHSSPGLCWHSSAGCVCQWVNLLLAPSRGQEAKKPKQTVHTYMAV